MTVAELIVVLKSFPRPETTEVTAHGEPFDYMDIYLCPVCGRVEIDRS